MGAVWGTWRAQSVLLRTHSDCWLLKPSWYAQHFTFVATGGSISSRLEQSVPVPGYCAQDRVLLFPNQVNQSSSWDFFFFFLNWKRWKISLFFWWGSESESSASQGNQCNIVIKAGMREEDREEEEKEGERKKTEERRDRERERMGWWWYYCH